MAIELQRGDASVLNELSCELGGVHKIAFKEDIKTFNGYTYRTESCIIRIYSKDIVYDLINKNVLPNKTNKKDFPICNHLFFEFLRGFFDGDGCIYINPRKQISAKFTNANLDFLNYLLKEIQKRLSISGSIYKETDKKYILMYYRKSDVKILLDSMYENSNCCFLNRKYEIYKSYYGSPA